MKLMKKMMSLLVALVMVFALATPVFAVNTEQNPNSTKHTIVIQNKNDGHKYQAYQIFSGDYVDEKLTNITWGTGVNSAALLAALKADTTYGSQFAACDTAEKVAEVLAKMSTSDLANIANIIGNNLSTVFTGSDDKGDTYEINVVGDGYYFIKDENNSLNNAHDAYTDYIIQVVGDVNMAPKSEFPSVDKLVWDEEADAEAGHNKGWNETADHHMNETFQFKLVATLPGSTEYAAYPVYKLVFTDTMSAGVTFEKIVSVTVDGKTITNYACTAQEGQAGGSWTLTIADVKGIEGVNLADETIVEVIYDAHLNEDAVVGNEDDNKNTVSLQYSNNPNVTGDAFGKTPEDTVWVFTYQVDVTKIDGAEVKEGEKPTKLPYAEFTLQNADKEYVVIDPATGKVKGWSETIVRPTDESTLTSVLISDAEGLIKVIGLDHGVYTLTETKAPEGYNLLKESIEITINAVHEELDETHAQTLNGNAIPGANVTVKNFAGATLPETGGIGTTLFYIFGGLLAVGAVVLLVTKKRVDA